MTADPVVHLRQKLRHFRHISADVDTPFPANGFRKPPLLLAPGPVDVSAELQR